MSRLAVLSAVVLLCAACGESRQPGTGTDGLAADAGSHDQHAADAGAHDQHDADAGSHDQHDMDGGSHDQHDMDAGSHDQHADAGTPSAKVGDSCASAADCPAGGSGAAMCLRNGYPDGYCSVDGCAGHGHDCPDDAGLSGTTGAKCVNLGGLRCMKLCSTNTDCRTGYRCGSAADGAGHGSAKVCVPL